MKLLHHGFRIREILRIETPVALVRPVEIIDDNHRDRKPAALVLSGNRKKLFLSLIAQLALPESGSIGRHFRCLSDDIGILLLNPGRRISCTDPVIHLLR